MGGLSHLIREHTEIMKPPRALWVPFELGRPFGSPGNAPFQIRVVVSALKLLEAPNGPVLADFPDDAPESVALTNHLVCPVSFASLPGKMTSLDLMLEAFRNEAANINSWYDLAHLNGERSTAGITGLTLSEIVTFFVSFISGSWNVSPLADVPVATALRMSAEDLKAIYFEGVAAQPGTRGDSTFMANWFWGETVAAQIINAIREICFELPDNDFQLLGKLLLVPRTQLHRFQEGKMDR